jgi:oxygen-independent coproporphyrinogen-3 oxidase
MQLGVYLHFPWCRKRCPYCDFAVELGEPPHARYADALLAELAARADGYSAAGVGELASIYVGGGTPSLWHTDELARVIAAVSARWPHVASGADRGIEVTVEANPCDVDPARLAAWRAAGVTRLSIGVQSHAADELVVLGRDHRFGDGPDAVARALAHGGFEVSADYILGVPTGRVALPPAPPATPHASVYELTIEERTAFGARARAGRLVPLPEDALVELYTQTHAAFTAAGFEHYEISSYARAGKRAVHNSLYWQGAPYLGLGASAASLAVFADGSGERAVNPRDADAYLAGAPAEVTHLAAAEMAVDRAWLAMRTSDGVAEDVLPPALAAELVRDGLAEHRAGRLRPTLRGFLMADHVASRIVQVVPGVH